MVYLSFKVKDIEFDEDYYKGDFLSIGTKDLKVYEKNDELIEKVGSFGIIKASVSDVKRISASVKYNDNLSFLLLGFKLDPNFTFKIRVGVAADQLCFRNVYCGEELKEGRERREDWLHFAYRGIIFNLIENPFSDDAIKEVKELKELINSYGSADTKEKLERVCQLVENDQIFNNYKKRLNDKQLVELETELAKLRLENKRLGDQNKFLLEQLKSVAQVEIPPK